MPMHFKTKDPSLGVEGRGGRVEGRGGGNKAKDQSAVQGTGTELLGGGKGWERFRGINNGCALGNISNKCPWSPHRSLNRL